LPAAKATRPSEEREKTLISSIRRVSSPCEVVGWTLHHRMLERVALLRTPRALFDGVGFLPESATAAETREAG
jgi:hypothetical protein